MATAKERRLAVRNAYRQFIGRNHYSQARRTYCVKPYKDGKYYSDCSSSVSYAYREAGEDLGMIMRTTNMYASGKFVDVPVVIKKGIIQNPEILEIGDILLFAGGDTARKAWGYVGHVEMVGEISGKTVTLYGHGSGLAKRHEMNAYCRGRYNTKASTPLGRRLLIKVRRKIREDGDGGPIQSGLRRGAAGKAVQDVQGRILKWNAGCLPEYGADGDFGAETEAAVKAFQQSAGLEATGIYDDATATALLRRIARQVVITGGQVNVRSGPGTQCAVLGIVREGDRLPFGGETYEVDGIPWYLVEYAGQNASVSGKYSALAEE